MRATAVPLAALLLAPTLAFLAAPGASLALLGNDDELPEPRYGYGATTLNGKGYLVGGGVEEGYSDDVLVLTPAGVSKIGKLPKKLIEPAAAGFGSKVYVFGGAELAPGANLPTPVATIHEIDTTSGDVSTLLSSQLPEPATSIAAVTHGSFIYLFGGLSLSPEVIDWKDWVLRFDPATKKLETVDRKLPTGRGQLAAVSAGDSILLLGGFAENDAAGSACPPRGDQPAATCFSDDVLRFRPSGLSGSMGLIGSLPERLRWAAVAHHEGTVTLFGGCAENCGAFYGSDVLVQIDAGSGAVTPIPVTTPIKGGRNQAVVLDGVGYVAGGAFRPPNEAEPQAHARIARYELGPTRPWAPLGLTASPTANDTVALDWSAPGYDGGAAILAYEVHRAAGAGESRKIAEVTGTSYLDATARLGATYAYKVLAANEAGAGPFSNEAALTPTATPGAPTLTASGGNAKVILQWTTPATTGGQPVAGYRIYAYESGSERSLWGEFTTPGIRSATVRTLGDGTPLENGKTYAFLVQARNGNGYGALSAEVEAVPSPVPDPPEGLEAQRGTRANEPLVNLTWQPPTSADVTGFVVYRGERVTELVELARTTEPRYTDDGDLPSGTTLLYAVAAEGPEGLGPTSPAVSVSFASPPGMVQALGARWTGTEVLVWWEAPEDDGGGELTGYELVVTRGALDPAMANATPVRLDGPPYHDRDPERGQPLSYNVRALGTGGPGPWDMVQVRVPLTEDSFPPKAALSVLPSRAPASVSLTFDSSGSTDDEGVVAYDFDFGDGTTTGWTSNPRVEHAYEAPGVYEASVMVRDLRGIESTRPASALIAIGPAPDVEDPFNVTTPPPENGTPVPWVLALLAFVGAGLVRRRR